MTTWRARGRLRVLGLISGTLAVGTMVVVGCQSVTQGSASVDDSDAGKYRTSVASSVKVSSSKSAARESERQASITAQAVHTACDELSTSSVNSIDAVNAFVKAYNDYASDLEGKARPARDALTSGADRVAAAISDPLSPDMVAAINDWIGAARALAPLVIPALDMNSFNAAIDRLNATKTHALQLCDAAY